MVIPVSFSPFKILATIGLAPLYLGNKDA